MGFERTTDLRLYEHNTRFTITVSCGVIPQDCFPRVVDIKITDNPIVLTRCCYGCCCCPYHSPLVPAHSLKATHTLMSIAGVSHCLADVIRILCSTCLGLSFLSICFHTFSYQKGNKGPMPVS